MLNPNRALDFIETLWQRGQLLGFLMGAVVSGLGTSWATWRLGKQLLPGKFRHENETLKEWLRDMEQELAHAREHSALVEKRCEELGQLNVQSRHRYDEQRETSASLMADRDALRLEVARRDDLVKQAELREAGLKAELAERDVKAAELLSMGLSKRWTLPTSKDVPQFVPLTRRRTPIISVVNLKGGVGKTTITANLGITLARRGCRVLLVDLDHQGSLTSISLSTRERNDAHNARRYARTVIGNGVPDRASALAGCISRADELCAGDVFVVATDELLEEVESEVMSHWLFGMVEDDVRFRLRQALHSPEVSSQYDLILLDCPPRLTTACVNALAASDFLLIPTLLERVSTEAIPRLLRWLRKSGASFTPDLSILGVVGNRVGQNGSLTLPQKDLWENLRSGSRPGEGGLCERIWGGPVKFFPDFLRQYPPTTGPLPAQSPAYQQGFNTLAQAIVEELPHHARPHPSAIHPVSAGTSSGGRG